MYEIFSDYYIFIMICEKNILKHSCEWKKSVFLQPLTDGALAQLARVSDWQSGGHGSDSRMLHKTKRLQVIVSVFFYMAMIWMLAY